MIRASDAQAGGTFFLVRCSMLVSSFCSLDKIAAEFIVDFVARLNVLRMKVQSTSSARVQSKNFSNFGKTSTIKLNASTVHGVFLCTSFHHERVSKS